jgi:hypothetical protein
VLARCTIAAHSARCSVEVPASTSGSSPIASETALPMFSTDARMAPSGVLSSWATPATS